MMKREYLFKSSMLTAAVLIIAALIFAWQGTQTAALENPVQDITAATEPQQQGDESTSTADHSEFEILQQDFQSGPEVTKACLSCHTEAAHQVMATQHWTWNCDGDDCNESQELGKKNIINNFCIGLPSNEPRCTSCHTGYGWKDNTFDFTQEEAVDCLVCHEQTGTYKKFPTGAGMPVSEPTDFSGKTFNPPDYVASAQSVAKPTNANCGTCHFYGGGGNGVKHGTLDSSLVTPPHDVDVHLSPDGANLQCVDCHQADAHDISGSRLRMSVSDSSTFSLPLTGHNEANCISCHGTSPMKDPKLNDHVDKIACQTCHIPEMARGGVPTKMTWDWSTAGERRDADGKPYQERDDNGYLSYDTKKGDFVWAENVPPEYVWANGVVRYTLVNDTVDPNTPVQLNYMEGSYADPAAKIFPVKVHRGKQVYDSGNNSMVYPHLFGKDENAYWKSYDWEKAIAAGMEYANEPYSGQWDWVETEMYWPATHMVAPQEQALQCDSCHTRDDSRLAALTDFYLPGRDHIGWLDTLAWLAIGGALLGVVVHGGMRFFSTKDK